MGKHKRDEVGVYIGKKNLYEPDNKVSPPTTGHVDRYFHTPSNRDK